MLKFFIGHRGTRINYDENTLDAFEIALNFGANYIEFDVRKTLDDRLVVFHDSRVDRLTNAIGYLEDYRYAEIIRIKLRVTNSRVPSLDEVLKRFRKRTKFIIELKSKNIRESVLKTISNHSLLKDCVISGRNFHELKLIKQNYPKNIVCYNITKGEGLSLEDFLEQGKNRSLNFIPDLINLQSEKITKEFIEICHENGIYALSWDFLKYNKPIDVIKGLIKQGIDGILFDNHNNIKQIKNWLEKKY